MTQGRLNDLRLLSNDRECFKDIDINAIVRELAIAEVGKHDCILAWLT